MPELRFEAHGAFGTRQAVALVEPIVRLVLMYWGSSAAEQPPQTIEELPSEPLGRPLGPSAIFYGITPAGDWGAGVAVVAAAASFKMR